MANERTFLREDLERIFDGRPLLLSCLTADLEGAEWPVPENALLERVHGRIMQRVVQEDLEEALGPDEISE